MVKMEQAAGIRSLPLSLLPNSTRQVLSVLLNSTKVIPIGGPKKLPRDWRGLAALANITSEIEASIQDHPDKTAKVLELWNRNGRPTIGDLLDNLIYLDRYDVVEDICLDLTEHSAKQDLRIVNNRPIAPEEGDDSEIITYDDRPGYKHHYDAYVLYAHEDQSFVDELKGCLERQGFQICTKERLLAGHATPYAPISKLIKERCLRIILVYSPEFLISADNIFFRDFSQAVSIQSRQNKTIPIMYRECTLPPHLALYHMLRYDSNMYPFWEKLKQSLNIARMPRIPYPNDQQYQNGALPSASSAVHINELTDPIHFFTHTNEERSAQRSASVENVPTTSHSSSEGSIRSENSQRAKKKANLYRRLCKKMGITPNQEILAAQRSASVDAVPSTSHSSPEGSISSETSERTKKKANFMRTFYKKLRVKPKRMAIEC